MPIIYPPELNIMSEIQNCPTWIFQLVYVVVNVSKVYDKRHVFNFNVVNFPYNYV